MSKELAIYGAGGLGKEILALVEDKYKVLGFVDDFSTGNIIGEYKVIGNIEWLLSRNTITNVIVCIANVEIRKKIVKRLKENKNIVFPTIIADSVKTSKYNQIGEGCIICDNSVLTVKVVIEDFCIIDVNSTIGHESHLNKYVTLYPSVNVSGNIEIGECTEIGTGSQIIQKINIGSNVIVGAGSVVIRDIPSNCTAVGVPAKPIKFN